MKEVGTDREKEKVGAELERKCADTHNGKGKGGAARKGNR